MKVAVISDTHYGARKGSQLFHDYFEKFYKEVFFPYLDEHNIKQVIHMGDCFDSRKGIEFKSLQWAKRVVFDELQSRGIRMHLMVGNHDAYYKNTNNINAVDLLLNEYDNVVTFSEIEDVMLDGLKVTYIPWINTENHQKTLQHLSNTKSRVAFGHLELTGFKVNKYVNMECEHTASMFKDFDKVFSGHFHTRSDDGKVFYLGNPYEMFWTDVLDNRGFTIFDTDTLEHTPINNPFRLFYNIYYEDDDHQLFDAREYRNKIVKVVVKKKSDVLQFEKFIDKLYSVGVADLKVVENFEFTGWNTEQSEEIESEDTLSILDRYIKETDTELNKIKLQNLMREIYQEACEVT